LYVLAERQARRARRKSMPHTARQQQQGSTEQWERRQGKGVMMCHNMSYHGSPTSYVWLHAPQEKRRHRPHSSCGRREGQLADPSSSRQQQRQLRNFIGVGARDADAMTRSVCQRTEKLTLTRVFINVKSKVVWPMSVIQQDWIKT
jgi:hypothetical protein